MQIWKMAYWLLGNHFEHEKIIASETFIWNVLFWAGALSFKWRYIFTI